MCIRDRCNEILPHHNLILSVSNQNYYLSHFYTDTIYMPGDSLHFNARILPFRQNANPGEFSYARYLKQKTFFFIYYRLVPSGKTVIRTIYTPFSIIFARNG